MRDRLLKSSHHQIRRHGHGDFPLPFRRGVTGDRCKLRHEGAGAIVRRSSAAHTRGRVGTERPKSADEPASRVMRSACISLTWIGTAAELSGRRRGLGTIRWRLRDAFVTRDRLQSLAPWFPARAARRSTNRHRKSIGCSNNRQGEPKFIPARTGRSAPSYTAAPIAPLRFKAAAVTGARGSGLCDELGR